MKFLFEKMLQIILWIKTKREGGEAFSSSLRKFYADKYNIHVGYGSYGWKNSAFPSGVYIGNYCSIADEVKIFRANHPINCFTTHPIFYNPVFKYVERDMLERPILNIGHDVWIGASSIILPSVKIIGNGSIIGAGSIVTKDVLPYSIIIGNPAKLIRMRFSDYVIMKLEESQWWMLNREELINNKKLFEDIIGMNTL